MVFSDDFRKKLNTFLALAVILLAGLFVVLKFDIFYDLNDDVVIKDILAGVYSGTPETRNMQMLYPMSFVLAVLYHAIPVIPWYGLMLGILQVLCLYLVTSRCMEFCARISGKLIMAVTILSVWTGLFLYRFVFLHYTVTAGIMVATAIFRFMTNYSTDPDEISFTQDTARVTKDDMPLGQFIKKNIINIILLVTAFCLRSELALLMLPFMGVAFILKWTEDAPIFTRENFEKFLSVFLIVVICGGLVWGVDNIAYSREHWKNFRSLFDARTEIYDFTGIPNYDENQEFYQSIEVSREEYNLMVSYNYNLSDSLNYEKFTAIADYADRQQALSSSPAFRNKQALWMYFHQYFSKEYQPWVWIGIFLCILILIVALLQKQFHILIKLALLFVFRMIPWMYIYYRGRIVERVTSSLFIVELLLLLAMLLMEFGIVVEKQSGYRTELRRMRILSKWEERRENLVRVFPIIALFAMLAVAVLVIPSGYKKTLAEFKNRQKASVFTTAVKNYMDEHSEVYFLIDVYSSTSIVLKENDTIVNISEDVYNTVSNRFGNYDILGGWIAKSPLYLDKLAYAEKKLISNEDEAVEIILPLDESVLENLKNHSELGYKLISDPDHYQLLLRSDRDSQWLTDFYTYYGIEVELELADSIGCETTDLNMNVYRVIAK